MPTEAGTNVSEFFTALQKREKLLAFLEENSLPFWKFNAPGKEGILFQLDNDQRWLARFLPNGNFRDLVWG